LLKRSAQKYGNEPAIGSRELIKIHKEKKKIPKVVDGETIEVEKEWTYYELSNYTYLTYQEYFTMVLQVGAGLRKLGLSPKERLHIFATTTCVIFHSSIRGFADLAKIVHNGSGWRMHAPRSP
jgi:long-chain acyl-CoA synthetase